MTRASRCQLLGCASGVVRDHQPVALPLGFGERLRGGVGRLCAGGFQQVDEFAVAPTRHRQDELQWAVYRHAQCAQRLDVVQRQQPPVGHHHQAPYVRESDQHLLQRGLQRWRIGRVAVEDLVVDGHTVGRLHHTEHELAGNDASLGHAEVPHIAVLLAQAFGANGGEVVEDHREVFVDQRAQQLCHGVVDRILVVHQCIHAAQQLLVRQ
jgi:hypothetical protein